MVAVVTLLVVSIAEDALTFDQSRGFHLAPSHLFSNVASGIAARQAWSDNLSAEVSAFLDTPGVLDPEQFKKERDPIVLHTNRRFDVLGPVGPHCIKLEAYGREKHACGLSELQAPCSVVSIGCKGIWDFEIAVFAKTPCHIHTFDCTVHSRIMVPERIRSRTSLHRVCIAARSYTDPRTHRVFEDWPTLLKRVGMPIQAPSFLKMDIEGFEYQVLRAVLGSHHLATGTSKATEALSLWPTQIAMELHFQTQMRELPFHGRLVSVGEIALFMDFLWRQGGYTLIDRRDNVRCPHCTEILIARIDRTPSVSPREGTKSGLISEETRMQQTASAELHVYEGNTGQAGNNAVGQGGICSRPATCETDIQGGLPMLVYHPESGLGNCLLGMSSAALMSIVLCRRFAVQWQEGADSQASASFAQLFEEPDGVSILGNPADLLSKQRSRSANTASGSHTDDRACTLNMNQHLRREDPTRHAKLMSLSDYRNFTLRPNGSSVSRCQVLHVVGNNYFAPLLARNPHMVAASKWIASFGLGGCNNTFGDALKFPPAPLFAAMSHHLFRPLQSRVLQADDYMTSVHKGNGSTAIVGVHVRTRLLSRLLNMSQEGFDSLLHKSGMIQCIEHVRTLASTRGFSTSKVYVAADDYSVVTHAASHFKDAMAPKPVHVVPAKEQPNTFSGRPRTAKRGVLATTGALDELLILARGNALVLWSLNVSTYGATAATWAAHNAGRQTAARRWLGVFLAGDGCRRLPDSEVEPDPASVIR